MKAFEKGKAQERLRPQSDEPKQAIAIGLSEASKSGAKVAEQKILKELTKRPPCRTHPSAARHPRLLMFWLGVEVERRIHQSNMR